MGVSESFLPSVDDLGTRLLKQCALEYLTLHSIFPVTVFLCVPGPLQDGPGFRAVLHAEHLPEDKGLLEQTHLQHSRSLL